MSSKINIALCLPDASHPDQHFSFRLQSDIQAPPCVYKTTPQLFVVSDIKGNFRPFYKLLIKNRIINRYFQWIFDEGHLVVLGNRFDHTEPATECLWFLYSLEQKAKAKGGYVHFIPGTHEIMHMNGKWRTEHPPYPPATAKVRSPITALYDANFELRRWLGARNIVEKIGSLLFAHGDVFPAMYTQHQTITDINAFARSVYTRLPETAPDELSASLFGNDDIFFRYPGCNDVIITEEQVNAMLKKFSINTIITGQAVQEQVTTAFDGKLINIATTHATNNPVGLFIKRGKFLQADRQGRKEKINL